MPWLPAFAIAAWVGLLNGALAQAPGSADADVLALGRRIYRDGVLPSGEPLRGIGPANVTLTGAEAACATCHRRSGYGSSEGPIEVRSITGPALFGERVSPATPGSPAAPVTLAEETGLSAEQAARERARALRSVRAAQFAGGRSRPVYDDVSLTRSLLEGIDVTGRRMHASMPRYALDPSALHALIAYLKTLSAQAAPGVTADAVHFATVIQPGTDPLARRALLDVVRTFFNDRNLGLRDEVRREKTGSTHLGRTYRTWVLHVWDLEGPSETWAAQLEAYYKAQPVFAMVSGLGKASWRPIHDFSERFEVPCIFPQADVPVLAERDFYTVYLSRGIVLEAQALARFLQDTGESGPVIQVFRPSDASAAGADAFRTAWSAASGSAPTDLVLDERVDASFLQQLAQGSTPATVVLWLSPSDLPKVNPLTSMGATVRAIFLSSTLIGGLGAPPASEDARVRLVYPQDPPGVRDARLAVVKRWMRNNGIAAGDETVRMNAYLAATVTGMLVSHSKDTYSREFLLERIEHRLGTAVELSIYPHLSLGPGQRYASKGSYIAAIGGGSEQPLKLLSDWIVP